MSSFKKLRRSRQSRSGNGNESTSVGDDESGQPETSSVGMYQCALCGNRYDKSDDLVTHVEGGYHSNDGGSSGSKSNRRPQRRVRVPKSGDSLEDWVSWAEEEEVKAPSSSTKRASVIHSSKSKPVQETLKNEVEEEEEALKPCDNGEEEVDEDFEEFSIASVECPQGNFDDGDSEKQVYNCMKCSETFTSAVLLKNHRVVHALDCPECGETFLIKPSLDRHIQETHSAPDDRAMEGSSCDSGVLSMEDGGLSMPASPTRGRTGKPPPQAFVSDILIVPTADGWFRCKICPKVCQARSDMSKHVRRHTNERPFSCDVCGEKFKHQSAIANHKRIHSGERPFECSYCGKKFSQPSNKRRHEALHRGEKPFNCSICNRNFSEKTTLQTHYLQHTGERPFVCNLCGKGHLTNSALKQHTNSRHGRNASHSQNAVDSAESRGNTSQSSPSSSRKFKMEN